MPIERCALFGLSSLDNHLRSLQVVDVREHRQNLAVVKSSYHGVDLFDDLLVFDIACNGDKPYWRPRTVCEGIPASRRVKWRRPTRQYLRRRAPSAGPATTTCPGSPTPELPAYRGWREFPRKPPASLCRCPHRGNSEFCTISASRSSPIPVVRPRHPAPIAGHLPVGKGIYRPANTLDHFGYLAGCRSAARALEQHVLEQVGRADKVVRLVSRTGAEQETQVDGVGVRKRACQDANATRQHSPFVIQFQGPPNQRVLFRRTGRPRASFSRHSVPFLSL